ncbi:MAG: hypothetical protein NTV88_01945 [Candidatus Micrarchaeota archaeon]|nr:hypothetical protein [Candidatus Micrarchaeota archaeon]
MTAAEASYSKNHFNEFLCYQCQPHHSGNDGITQIALIVLALAIIIVFSQFTPHPSTATATPPNMESAPTLQPTMEVGPEFIKCDSPQCMNDALANNCASAYFINSVYEQKIYPGTRNNGIFCIVAAKRNLGLQEYLVFVEGYGKPPMKCYPDKTQYMYVDAAAYASGGGVAKCGLPSTLIG